MESLIRSRSIALARGPGPLVAFGVTVLALALVRCGGDVPGQGAGGEGSEVQELGSPTGGGAGANGPSSGGSSPPALLAAPEREIPVSELGYTVGDTTAPLRVLEFSDFGCGYCRQFHLETYPAIEREYIATGRVQWKYVPMILGIFGPAAEVAAHAGECALEQGGGFPAMRHRIFEGQPEWKRASDPMVLFEDYARDAGLDVPRWRGCVQEGRRGDRIAGGTTVGLRSGVRGTPTFFVAGHGTIPGSVPLSLFRQVLDQALAAEAGR